MSNAAERYVAIMDALMAGRTVYLRTALRAVKLTQKSVDLRAAYGRPVLKLSGQSLYVARGKFYDCADGYHITIH